jgi:hypothetical protein
MINKKYITRRILDTYSEEVFARKLRKKEGQQSFYPFKDIGIDIVGIDKNHNPFFYQLKARRITFGAGHYKFMVNIDKLKEFPKKNSFWVFCCFKEDYKFDFFIVPLDITKKWFDITNKKANKKHKQYHLRIKPISERKYELAPKWMNDCIRIQDYLLK